MYDRQLYVQCACNNCGSVLVVGDSTYVLVSAV